MTVTHVLIKNEVETPEDSCTILTKVAGLIKTSMEENEGSSALVYCRYAIRFAGLKNRLRKNLGNIKKCKLSRWILKSESVLKHRVSFAMSLFSITLVLNKIL